MYDELDEHRKRRYTVEQIAAEFGVTRPTIYRYLNKTTHNTPAADQALRELRWIFGDYYRDP
ncbi:helix-turn-helix domain-containing protein [Nocardia amikacinitolerans]|uniref:helix-turn-helix domain-containing protein n=1 Tax=Nocardia amikacinitolerans TaxID=756689 RepID=UPI0036B157F2